MNGEVIFMRLTDVGRKIHLKEAGSIFPGIPDKKIIKTKNTPSYLDFPEWLRLDFQQEILSESKYKIYLRKTVIPQLDRCIQS